MTLVRNILVSIVAVGLVVTLGQASLARGESHGGHESHGKAGHEGHHEEHHDAHHEEHHEGHEEHHDAHHEEGHHDEHHDAHHEEHPEEHHDAHHDEHHDEHHDAHHEEHPGEHHDAHHDEHHDDHHDDHHDAHHDHHEIDHKDWYQHEWWHHQMSWHHESWQHWWHCPSPTEITHWSAGWGLGAPVYYDYGSGGNVVYRNNGVYVNGGLVGTPEAYANSAIALAQASPTTNVTNVSPTTNVTNVSPTTDTTTVSDATDTTDDQSEQWMPLGTFAVLPQDGDNQPSQTLQLALDKNGSISGVLFDLSKDTSTPIHGSLDRATQRVAFDLGAESGLVAETGLYNLTKDEVTLLVHKGTEKPETYTLVRFQTPPASAAKEGVAQASQ